MDSCAWLVLEMKYFNADLATYIETVVVNAVIHAQASINQILSFPIGFRGHCSVGP
jgi:hypothetical protein